MVLNLLEFYMDDFCLLRAFVNLLVIFFSLVIQYQEIFYILHFLINFNMLFY